MFKPASLTEVSELILPSPNKSRELDPIPTFLLKYYLSELIVPITKIINLSLRSGVFPYHFKHVHVNPFLKKPSLPANDLNSYRPIFILTFISKVLEKVLSSHLNIQLNCNHLSAVFYSAYEQFQSTETTLLKVHNDISLNIDTGTQQATDVGSMLGIGRYYIATSQTQYISNVAGLYFVVLDLHWYCDVGSMLY